MTPGADWRTVRGVVFDIQRMSIHDGPGIRTTVFLKGCPLQCRWCHNPEGRDGRPQLAFTPSLCIGCGYCFAQCPEDAHINIDGKHRLLRDRCRACFACANECYAKALEVIGNECSAVEVMDEVVRDKPFYDESGGGMTLSGGEPLAQPAFATALLEGARAAGLHTCVETCGFVPPEVLDRLDGLVDLFLFDLKETDPERHRTLTGVDSALILSNLRMIDAAGAPLLLRCPIVPGANLRDDHLQGIVDVAGALRHCRGVHLMAHHRLGESKRARLGLPEPKDSFRDMPRDEALALVQRLGELGLENAELG